MNAEQLREAAVHDIRYWAIYHEMKCPNCGADLNKMHPMANLYPHWDGSCREKVIPFEERKP